MAVPPTQPTRAVTVGPEGLARTLGVSTVLDVILGLLVAVVLPLAIVAIPNTISVVAALLPPEISQIAMVRAHGLALPAMVLTVPLAAVAVRRVRAAPILVAGLTLLALADAAGGFADSAPLVGVLRVLHGVGAGLLVPATLVAVSERSPLLRAVWGGMLAVSLLTAQALALWPLDEVRSWRVTLQPYPMLTGVALVLAAVYLVLWMRSGESAAAGGAATAERGRLLTAVVPAVGITALALGSTFDWPPGLLVLAAVVSVLALFWIGAFAGAGGRVPAYTMLAVGVVVLPTAAQVTYVELGGLGGPGLSGLWPAFVIAGVAGLAAAALVSRLGDGALPLVGAGGLVVVVAGLCAVRLLLPAAEGPALILPFVLLGVGAAVALTSALRSSGPGAALFALSLFFPAVLSGFLLGSGVQVIRLKEATTSQALVDGFVGALHLWALMGGGLVVAVIVLCAVLARRSPSAGDDGSGTASTAMTAGSDGSATTAGPDGFTGPAASAGSVSAGTDAVAPAEASRAGAFDDSGVQSPSGTEAPAPTWQTPASEAAAWPRPPVRRAAEPGMIPEPATELEPLAGLQPSREAGAVAERGPEVGAGGAGPRQDRHGRQRRQSDGGSGRDERDSRGSGQDRRDGRRSGRDGQDVGGSGRDGRGSGQDGQGDRRLGQDGQEVGGSGQDRRDRGSGQDGRDGRRSGRDGQGDSGPGQDRRDRPGPFSRPQPDPRPQPDKTGTLPVVPPPTPSPEDAPGDGPARS
ncbi:hypothetical protein [Streptosporangium sp. NPDC003464]